MRSRSSLLSILTLVALLAPAGGQELATVRVASYNIQFLNAAIPNARAERIKTVIEQLDADIIGLQEINDRPALQRVFSGNDWQLVIDDDSQDSQDVAVAVRKPFLVRGLPMDLDAEDAHFLFPGTADNTGFPNRRDVLVVEVGREGQTGSLFVMVHHAKARSEGRDTTDMRRVEAARKLLTVLQDRFDERDFVLLGDFNDNPDDRSLNILESGNPNAAGGAEEIEGPFMLNLMEPLVAADHVSHGRDSQDILGSTLNTVDTGSRKRNNDLRGTDQHTGDILFDQLLVPGWMKPRYVAGSARVFNGAVAMEGGANSRASDHLPVFAEFTFGNQDLDDPDGPMAATGPRIASLLPNPPGPDTNREEVTVANRTQMPLSLTGWKIRDRSSNEFALSGTLAAGSSITIRITTSQLQLNNSGDEVVLVSPDGEVKQRVSYTAIEASPGSVITFP